MGYISKTVHGYDAMELISALHKCLRRGMERHAMCYAMELALSDATTFGMMCNRLVCMAHEDIGPADYDAVLFTMVTVDKIREDKKKNRDDWDMMLANVIMRLCRAPKSTDGCDLAVVARSQVETCGIPAIPDFAFDKHTVRGRKMKRGWGHFLSEGRKLVPEAEQDLQKYRREAENVFLLDGKGKSGDVPQQRMDEARAELTATYDKIEPERANGMLI